MDMKSTLGVEKKCTPALLDGKTKAFQQLDPSIHVWVILSGNCVERMIMVYHGHIPAMVQWCAPPNDTYIAGIPIPIEDDDFGVGGDHH